MTAQVGAAAKEVNVLDWMSRTALELVGQGGLGYSFDPLVEPKPNVFSDAIKSFVYVAIFGMHIPTYMLKQTRVVLPASMAYGVAVHPALRSEASSEVHRPVPPVCEYAQAARCCDDHGSAGATHLWRENGGVGER